MSTNSTSVQHPDNPQERTRNTKPSRRFHLYRRIDESGMSGTGVVARGVQFPSGKVVMEWVVAPYSIQMYNSVEDLHFIHRHGARNTTDLVWDDPEGAL